MDKRQFQERLAALFAETLNGGPGPRAVAKITASQLGTFIANEAGASTPDAIEEAVRLLREVLQDKDAT